MILPSSAAHTADPAHGAPPTSAAMTTTGAPVPLDTRAQRLFASLPHAHRLPVTRRRFPHVLNRIAAEWDVPKRLLDLMDELLLDRRGHREGFPFDAMLELTSLREHYLSQLPPGLRERLEARGDAWSSRDAPHAAPR